MISDFIIALVPGLFVMNAIRVFTDDGHIFSFVQDWFPEPMADLDGLPIYKGNKQCEREGIKNPRLYRLRERMSKPMWSCEYCTASIWGSVSFFIFGFGLAGFPLWVWPAYCVALVGFRFELFSFSKFLEVTIKTDDEDLS